MYTEDLELLGSAAICIAMVVGVFGVGVAIEIPFNHRFGITSRQRPDARSQAPHQAVRSQLGGFGPGGGPQS